MEPNKKTYIQLTSRIEEVKRQIWEEELKENYSQCNYLQKELDYIYELLRK